MSDPEITVTLERTATTATSGAPCATLTWREDHGGPTVTDHVVSLPGQPPLPDGWLRINWLAGYCPVQGDGTMGGEPFYFRARHAHWDLTLHPTDPVAAFPPEIAAAVAPARPVATWYYREPFGPPDKHEAGYMAIRVALYSILRCASARHQGLAAAVGPATDAPAESEAGE